ncbi:hypothetical protein AJ80_04459 [Polytolypa hystricis UAMH7299]|uniref:Uncharacterized protein n=1 Tax=Polytolypa hystricis (strain UAMH7299) TaxID=1447883 RepID=A0A2B7YBM0_POLH7|nr:hypothetical protein AJ80_04459 [Polytolypa hystricis UAMH7299]
MQAIEPSINRALPQLDLSWMRKNHAKPSTTDSGEVSIISLQVSPRLDDRPTRIPLPSSTKKVADSPTTAKQHEKPRDREENAIASPAVAESSPQSASAPGTAKGEASSSSSTQVNSNPPSVASSSSTPTRDIKPITTVNRPPIGTITNSPIPPPPTAKIPQPPPPTARSETVSIKSSMKKRQPPPVIPPLTKVHFACFQSHRTFVASKNARYPVPCMTCLKHDKEMRWRCTFCCLRICAECLQGIRKCKGRSLKELMENLLKDLEEGA